MNIERTYGNVPLNVTMTKTVISMLMSIITVVMVNGLIQGDLLLVGQIKSQHMSRMVRMLARIIWSKSTTLPMLGGVANGIASNFFFCISC